MTYLPKDKTNENTYIYADGSKGETGVGAATNTGNGPESESLPTFSPFFHSRDICKTPSTGRNIGNERK